MGPNVTLFVTNVASDNATWGLPSPANSNLLRNILAHDDTQLDLQITKVNTSGDGTLYYISYIALDILYTEDAMVYCGTGSEDDTNQFCCDCSAVDCGVGGNVSLWGAGAGGKTATKPYDTQANKVLQVR